MKYFQFFFFHNLLILFYNIHSHPLYYAKNSTECIDDYYEFGDFCYFTCNGTLIPDESGIKKQCKCANDTHFIQEIKFGEFNYYQCVESCPHFYSLTTRKCVDKCEGEENKITDNKGCKSSCGRDELYYESDDGKKYCVKECPDDKKFYYENSWNGEKECIQNCKKYHFYSNKSQGYECSDECENLSFIDLENNIFFCSSKSKESDSECTNSSFPYYFKRSCLRNCQDTQKLEMFNNATTYLFTNKDNKTYCSENCLEYYESGTNTEGTGTEPSEGRRILETKIDKSYIVPDQLLCVKDCSSTSYKFHNGSYCIESCEKKNNIDFYSVEDTGECVTKCGNDYYLLREQQKCYHKDSPPKEYGKTFIDSNENEWVNCTKPNNINDRNYYEGYFIKNYTKCLPSCPTEIISEVSNGLYKYHKNDDNECLLEQCKDNDPYKYYKSGDDSICYKSCKDIGGNYIYEYGNECKNTMCESFYYKSSGIFKCFVADQNEEDTEIKFCSTAGLYYLRGKECVNDCNKDEYKTPFKSDTTNKIKELGICSSECNFNGSTKFTFDENLCDDDCPLPYRKIKDNLKDNIYKKISEGNCLLQCPNNYYEYDEEDGESLCLKNCPEDHYSFIISNEVKTCVKSCKEINKFLSNGECVDECKDSQNKTKYSYYYYNDTKEENQCLDSCTTIGKFAFSAIDSHQKCIDQCPNEYYHYISDNLCRTNCNNGFYKNGSDKICVTSCEDNQYIINGNKCTEEKCPPEEPFYVTKTFGSKNVKKCTSSCKNEGYNVYTNNTGEYECIKTCLDVSFGDECMKECPQGTYKENNKCKTKCDESLFAIPKKNQNNEIYYECKNTCDKYIAFSNQCLDECPISENFIGLGNKCKSSCNKTDGEFYKFFKNSTDEKYKIYYKIYTCVQNCGTDEFVVNGKKECLDDCQYPYYKSYSDRKCYLICLENPSYPFSTKKDIDGGGVEYICSTKCEKNEELYYGEDKICQNNCTGQNNIINGDNSCVSKCDLESDYKFYYEDGQNKYCKDSCPTNKKYYYIKDFICTEKCEEPYGYLISQNQCDDKCPEEKFAIKGSETSDYQYKCDINCDSSSYYYDDQRICIDNCTDGYNIEGTKRCISSCDKIQSDGSSIYYFYEPNEGETQTTFKINTCVTECPSDKPFIDYNHHCSAKCENLPYQYYNSSTKECLNKCDGVKLETNVGFECRENCPGDKFLDIITNTCNSSCSELKTGNIYYYEEERKCIQECKKGDYIFKKDNNYICVSKCPEETFINGLECTEICPVNKNFVIARYEFGETELNKECMTDCTSSYPFYKAEIDLNDLKKCYRSCDGYYITNKDPKINAKNCVENCENNYSFSFKHNNTHKECFEICPNYAKFYDNNTICYNNCASIGLYHDKNDFLCIEECSYKTANYTTKECMSSCGINQKWIMKDSTKLCLNNCNELDYNTFENIDGECVVSCPSDKFLISNRGTKKCECQGLYYYNESDYKECLAPNITSCENSNTEYTIQIDGESQCLKNCFGALSANGKICYMPKENGVIKCPNNTKLEIIDGKLTCNCEYNYYNDENNEKICLGKEEKCPEKRYLIPDTKECVPECKGDYPYLFDNKCFNKCPSGTQNNDDTNPKTCSCEYKWYKISENNNDNYYCLDENEPCNNNYPKLIKETKECVKNCGSEYIENDNICFSSCDGDYYKVEENGKNICRCRYKWYSNETGVQCKEENDNKDCEKLHSELRFLIKDTKECVISCPKEYPYYFNKECYKSCEDEENLVNKNNTEDYECQCSGKWRVKNGTEIECISEPECGDDEYSLENQQCIPNTTCPNDYYLFNKICYKKCPTNTDIDLMKPNECKCKSLWFRRDEGSIACLRENKCPYPEYPYLIQETNQCVKEETDCNKYLIFNYNCSFNCPINTIKNTKNICICDKDKGFYKNITDNNGQTILECGLPVCPVETPKYHNETKECVSNCIELNAYDYLGICYEECPPLTVKDDNNHICKLTEQFEDKNLTNLVKNLREEIKTIYENLPIGGLVINNENDATVQIYGLGKKNSEEKKNSIIRTNLAYIDLSGCIEKIYESNDMEPGDEIIVVKVDLKSKNKNLVVNPIEYEFVNSRTAEVLDASVCEKSEVVVSYPITYMLKNKNKLRNLDDGSENEDDAEEEAKEKEIMNKFNRGKDLYDKDNSIDSFNYNSTIYRDICYPIKVDGKDMILENRITYFYPNYSFCESSCTYDKTDFAGERIYCNCSIKNEIEIDRPHTVKLVQYNQNETDNNQIGPTNIPVLKCISKAKISSNGAFYYCIVLIVIEIGLLLVFIFQGYSSLNSKIRKKAFKEEINESNMDEDEKIEDNKKNKISKYNNSNTDEGFKNEKTNKRDKSHPPKKKENNANEGNNKNNDNEVINIKKHKNKNRNQEIQRIIDEKNNFEIFSEQNSEKENNTEDVELKKYLQKQGIDTPMAFYHSMRKEEKLLREKFSISKIKDKFDSIIVVLTSIFDKIYFIKILLLSGKYEIISIMFSLYLLCHMMLLTFAGFFFDIKTLKKIWEKDDYPDLNYYLGYGFAGNLIVWVIFRIFCCLLENNNKVKSFMKGEKSLSKIRKQKKYNKLMSAIKRNIIIYLCIQFALIMFCSFYLITFCGIYLGTKEKVFQAYGIAFIEIIIIKIIYGAILGVLRKVSLYTKKSMLYNVVLIFNKYIS